MFLLGAVKVWAFYQCATSRPVQHPRSSSIFVLRLLSSLHCFSTLECSRSVDFDNCLRSGTRLSLPFFVHRQLALFHSFGWLLETVEHILVTDGLIDLDEENLLAADEGQGEGDMMQEDGETAYKPSRSPTR